MFDSTLVLQQIWNNEYYKVKDSVTVCLTLNWMLELELLNKS